MRLSPRALALAALTAATGFILSIAAPAAAQDPPPPLPPSDAPLPPPDAPPAPMPPAGRPEPPARDRPASPAVEPPTPPPGDAEPGPRPPRDDARFLKGQTLLTPALLDSAFVATHVAIGGELGRQSDDASSFNIVTGHVQAGVSFAGRVELGLEASYAGFVVGDQNTAIQPGGQNAYDLRPGLRLRAFRSASTGTQLGLRAYGVFDSSTRLNPGRVFAEVASQLSQIAADPARFKCLTLGQLDCALVDKNGKPFDLFAAMRVSRSLLGGGAAVSVAQAFNARLATQASVGLEIGHGSSSTKDLGTLSSTPVTFYLGVAPSFALGPSVPVALMAEYRLELVTESFSGGSSGAVSTASTNTALRHGFAGGVYYTGRPELQLGAAFKGSVTANSADGVAVGSTTALSGLVTMRYFF